MPLFQKRIFEQSLSYDNESDSPEEKAVGGTHLHMKGVRTKNGNLLMLTLKHYFNARELHIIKVKFFILSFYYQ